MEQALILPPGVAFAIIAFLLSLLPAGLFIWLWYLRRHDRPVPFNIVTWVFLFGIALVYPAFKLEEWASNIWYTWSPSTAHYFAGSVLPLQTMADVVLPAFGTFVVVALVEEGLRYILLRVWFRYDKNVDQISDGLVLGIAAGLGFATMENTIYFLGLFSQGSFDTLVFVFFLRFMISTLAHISFGGLMGALIARGLFHPYWPKRYLFMAFLIPWFIHGLYDLLLGLEMTIYAVLILLPGLLVLISWSNRRDFFAISRKGGSLLVQQKAPVTRQAKVMKRFFEKSASPWNKGAPWLRERRVRYTLLSELERRDE